MKRLRRFLRLQEGATAVEYAVMLALILMIAIGAIALLGQQTSASWTNSKNSLQSVGFGAS